MKKKLLLLSLTAVCLLFSACAKSVKTDAVQADTDKNVPASETEKKLYGNSITESGIKDISDHSGLFDISMSGYRGEIFIGTADNKFYGTIKFFNWGNGVPQPLIDLKVHEDKIYFKRQITTKEELAKYGGTAFFEQEFYGIFSADRKIIKGYYRYLGTQDSWQAYKK